MSAFIKSITLEHANTTCGESGPLSALHQERERAKADLLAENSFHLHAKPEGGPYALAMSMTPQKIIMSILCSTTQFTDRIEIAYSLFHSYLRDYEIICDNFQKTAQAGEFHRLEAIDGGRRGLHNEAAEMLIEQLEHKVVLDKPTARRLFTLLYVLRLRSPVSHAA